MSTLKTNCEPTKMYLKFQQFKTGGLTSQKLDSQNTVKYLNEEGVRAQMLINAGKPILYLHNNNILITKTE